MKVNRIRFNSESLNICLWLTMSEICYYHWQLCTFYIYFMLHFSDQIFYRTPPGYYFCFQFYIRPDLEDISLVYPLYRTFQVIFFCFRKIYSKTPVPKSLF